MKDTVEKLIIALGDKDWNVRWKAVELLGEMGPTAVEPLITALRDSSDSYIRAYAARALAEIGDARAVEPLIKLLGDSIAQGSAAEALAEIGAPAVDPLIKACRDSNEYVRKYASKALGKIGDARTVGPLIRALGDSNYGVQWNAAEALEKLHWSPANDTEKAYYFIARRDWASVVFLGVPAIEPLNKIQGYNNADVQKNATDALNKIYSQITGITFGEIPSNNTKTCVKNLETKELTIPMSGLRTIHIDADTYDFDMVERFITYAINYVGQKHLKKKVEVHIYGNPEKLHPNLLNSFKNLCRKVVVCKK